MAPQPDLVLLDIQLAGKKDGIDVAQKLNELYDIPFIFLTANSDIETIDRAKKVKPHAYIVKPFTKEELYVTIEIVFNNFNDKKAEKTFTSHSKDFLFVKVGYVFKKIFLSELLYLESDANYVTLHLKSHKKVIARSTLNDFMEQIDQKIFFRVHRSYCVNINLIEDVFPTELSIQGIKIPIGKSYKDELFERLWIYEA